MLKRIACPDKGKNLWNSHVMAGIATMPKSVIRSTLRLGLLGLEGGVCMPLAAGTYVFSNDQERSAVGTYVRNYGSRLGESVLTVASLGVIDRRATSLIQTPSVIARRDTDERMLHKLGRILERPIDSGPEIFREARYLFDIPIDKTESDVTRDLDVNSLSELSREDIVQLISDLNNDHYVSFSRPSGFGADYTEDSVYVSREDVIQGIETYMRHKKNSCGTPAESTFRALWDVIPSDDFREMAKAALAVVRLKRADPTYKIEFPARRTVKTNQEKAKEKQVKQAARRAEKEARREALRAQAPDRSPVSGAGGSARELDPAIASGAAALVLGALFGG